MYLGSEAIKLVLQPIVFGINGIFLDSQKCNAKCSRIHRVKVSSYSELQKCFRLKTDQ